MEKYSFIECDACRVKPGTPTLCKGCIHNRDVISKMNNTYNSSSNPNAVLWDEYEKQVEMMTKFEKSMTTIMGISDVAMERTFKSLLSNMRNV